MPIFPVFAISFCVKNTSRMTVNNAKVPRFNLMTSPSPSAAAVNFLFTPSIRRGAPGPAYTDRVSYVLTVAAKFHRPSLNSTSVALCYLSVISHVHFWLTKKEEKVCVSVCVIRTRSNKYVKCEAEKERCIVGGVCC